MSITNFTRKLLDIQDKNIHIDGEGITIEEYKGRTYKFIHATLTYEATHCPHCHIKIEGTSIYKNGTQTSRINIPTMGVHPVYLLLKKQRFMCKPCGRSFTAKTSIVKRHCFISSNTKAQILVKTPEAQSIKSISRDCNVSDATVQRILNDGAKAFKPYHKTLPSHLSFDEFKYAKSHMAFEYINAETGAILDILDRRDSRTIKNHFITYYSLKNRKQVKTITIDMNAGYVTVIKELFPHAEIIIDRFHLVQLISRSMNKTRVTMMNRFKTSNGEDLKKYRRLKAYWKRLLKKQNERSYTNYKYYRLFGQRLEVSIVQEILAYDSRLRRNYQLYQNLLRAMNQKNYVALENILSQPCHQDISTYLRTSIQTLRKHLPYMKNSFYYTYNNGRIEGINNKIKVLNRVAYGYRNFTNYKNRILVHFQLKPVERTTNKRMKNKTRPKAA